MMLELAETIEFMCEVCRELVKVVDSHATAIRGHTARLEALEARMGAAERKTAPAAFCSD